MSGLIGEGVYHALPPTLVSSPVRRWRTRVGGIDHDGGSTAAPGCRARRLLLKVGIYAGPAILATALTAQNVYASGHSGS